LLATGGRFVGVLI